MKPLAPLAILLLFACSSATDVIDERTLDCESGHDISVMAGLSSNPRETVPDQPFELLVSVSNNSHDEVTVTAIRAEQPHSELARYRAESAYRKFDQVVPEGKDHTFHLPLRARAVLLDDRLTRASSVPDFELSVTVILSNGDSYRCPFAFEVDR